MSSKIPSVLSVQRGTIVTDGIMSSLVPTSNGDHRKVPVRVIRHGIRGVLPKKEKDSVSNPQRTESAKTVPTAVGLDVTFSFRTIPKSELLFACSDVAYRQALGGFIERFFKRGVKEFDEVCLRYARNIFAGRWLWRNRVFGAPVVEAKLTTADAGTYTSQWTPQDKVERFEQYSEDEQRFAADVVASGLLGANVAAEISGRVLFGFAGEVEVFPSQNMVTAKPDGFARSLYKVDMVSRRDLMAIMGSARKDGEDAGEFSADMIDMGVAALRDQKIGNAIRTIDTWYAEYANTNAPISIEPNGANLEANVLYRDGRQQGAKDLLTLVDELQPGADFDPRAAYLIALLVRGGVFSEKQ